MTISFILNGEDENVRVRSSQRLADLLRDEFGLLSLRPDCRCGRCGKCLVFLDGKLLPSCMVPAFSVRGREVITIEGFSLTNEYAVISEAFERAGVESCGFCREPKIMAAAALLERAAKPQRREILELMSVVSCRCTEPEALVRAIEDASERRAGRLYRRAAH